MLTTNRCKLVALKSSDLESIVRLNTDPDVRRYLGGPQDEEVIRAQFPKLLASERANQYWAIRAKSDDTFIGIGTLSPHHDGDDTEISYLLLPEWWGKGYATEAVQALIDHGLTEFGLPRVIAETQTANLASRRLLDRVGMRFERTVQRFGEEQSIYTTYES